MKKSRVIILLVTVAVSVMCVGILAGCNKSCLQGGDKHLWKEKIDMSWLGGEPTHKDPTCVEDGYTDYWCNLCSKEKREVLPALGHKTVIDIAGVAPTCTTEGREDVSHCSVCNASLGQGGVIDKIPHDEYKTENDVAPTCTSTGVSAEIKCRVCDITIHQHTVLPMAEHTVVIDIAEEAPTCTQGGMAAKSHCSVCNQTISERTAVKPTGHKYKLSKSTATCKSKGVETYICSACGDSYDDEVDAYGHKDVDSNQFCDICDYPFGSHVKYISDLNGLAAIAGDLSAVYVLTSDITVNTDDWMPIGTKEHPFVGTFFGDEHTIYGLTQVNGVAGGLFGYNGGKIEKVNISGFKIGMDRAINDGTSGQNEQYFVGALCAYNTGTIKECTITGANTVISKSWFGAKATNTGVKDTKFACTAGGFCAVNYGNVIGCEITGSIVVTYSQTTVFEYHSQGQVFVMVEHAKVTGDFSFGGIAGVNRGTISNCAVNGTVTGSASISASQCDQKYGIAYSYGTVKIGSLIGENTASSAVEKCGAKKAVYTKDIQSSWMDGNQKGEVITFNEYNDSVYGGVIAKNDGTVIGFVQMF